MRITVFSSNQPRHIHLVKKLSEIADKVYFVSEVNTVFPGRVSDFFKKSEVMQIYFENVIESERRIFGEIEFTQQNVRSISIKSGDLNLMSREQLADALQSDVYVIFGSSFIKGWLIDFLVERGAINIHMGLSPYYRGSSCNFWALYDDKPGYVGATIHMLSKGLDSGEMLFHCIPRLMDGDTPFDFTMRSVLAAHTGLCETIKDGSVFTLERVKQDRAKEVRYTRNAEFTDKIADEFLKRNYTVRPDKLQYPELISPLFY